MMYVAAMAKHYSFPVPHRAMKKMQGRCALKTDTGAL
jgi:hypothetical protein